MIVFRYIACSILVLCISTAASADPYAVGDKVDAFALEDQHGESLAVDEAVEIVLFSRDMDGGDVLKEALADTPPEALPTRNAVYVSDISGMPGLVAKLFAVPSMRRRPYPMALDREGQVTARIPDVEKKATLVFLERLTITRVLHLATPGEVREALGLAIPAD